MNYVYRLFFSFCSVCDPPQMISAVVRTTSYCGCTRFLRARTRTCYYCRVELERRYIHKCHAVLLISSPCNRKQPIHRHLSLDVGMGSPFLTGRIRFLTHDAWTIGRYVELYLGLPDLASSSRYFDGQSLEITNACWHLCQRPWWWNIYRTQLLDNTFQVLHSRYLLAVYLLQMMLFSVCARDRSIPLISSPTPLLDR